MKNMKNTKNMKNMKNNYLQPTKVGSDENGMKPLSLASMASVVACPDTRSYNNYFRRVKAPLTRAAS